MWNAWPRFPIDRNDELRSRATKLWVESISASSFTPSPDDLELPDFFVGEQELVDLEGTVRGLVFVFNELRLVVAKRQKHSADVAGQCILFFVNNDVQYQNTLVIFAR